MSGFALLAVEAARDALRRRFAIAVALALVVGLHGADSCTGAGLHDLTLNERPLDPALVAGFLAPILLALQALFVLVIAGVLASDHLARPLAEGSAVAWLARPVSRAAYAGARLAGALAIAGLAGAALLGGSGALLVMRHGLDPAPALAAGAASALGAAAVASLAMAASLVVGRAAVLLLVLVGVPLQVFSNALVTASALVHPDVAIGGLPGALDRLGPPLGTALFAALAPWNPHVDAGGALAPALARLALWAAAGTALLVVAFRRAEIGR